MKNNSIGRELYRGGSPIGQAAAEYSRSCICGQRITLADCGGFCKGVEQMVGAGLCSGGDFVISLVV